MTFTYTDRDLDELSVEPGNGFRETAFVRSEEGVFIPASDLPTIVAELYRAAGQEPPIILPRRTPEVAWVRRGQVRPVLIPAGDMTPTEARDLAALYASAADLAEVDAEHERARVRVSDLAALVGGWDPWMPASSAETLARRILDAGYARGEA